MEQQFSSMPSEPEPEAYRVRESFRVGTALATGLGTLFRNFPAFLLLALVTYSPLIIYTGTRDAAAMTPDDFTLASNVVTWGSLLLQMLLAGAVTYGVVEQMNGRRASIGKSVTAGLRSFLPTLGLFVVTFVAFFGMIMVAGMLAFGLTKLSPVIGVLAIAAMIPVLIALYLGFYVAVPSLVIERTGVFGAISRSFFLIRGNRWRLFGLLLLLGVITMIALFVVAMVVGVVIGAAGGTGGGNQAPLKLMLGVTVGVQVLAGLINATIAAVTYVLLRNDKDGVGVGELSRVFD